MAAAVTVATVSAADLSECTELNSMSNLYLKPIARLVIVVTMPAMKVAGVTVSNWEIMERLKAMVAPEQFSSLKVAKSSLELLTFDAEVDSKTTLMKFLIKLDGKAIKLNDFAEQLRVRAARKKVPVAKKNDWNNFFRESPLTNEKNPGERPDTILVNHLPTKWFVENEKDTMPSENMVSMTFAKFGEVRAVDIPINDPFRDRINLLGEAKESKKAGEEGKTLELSGFKTFSHTSNIVFDCYVQFSEYSGFAKCMKALRGKKMLYMLEDEKGATANIEFDFDKTQHMSDKNIKRRSRRRERLIRLDAEEEEKRRKEQEEVSRKEEIEKLERRRRELLELKEVQDALQQKEERRRLREEKRKKKREEDRNIVRQQKEREKKILELTEQMKRQRKEEAIALVTELLKRISQRKQEEEIAEARRQAEILLRKQIEEKKKKLDEEKKKEKELKKKRMTDLDDEEENLKRRLKKIMLEKRERSKDQKRSGKIKKMKTQKVMLKSAVVKSRQ